MGSNPAITSADFDANDGHTYTFRVRAHDTAGNPGAWSTGITTTIDATAPESQVSAPANSQTADFDVTWSGSDATSGIVSYDVQYKDGDGAWTGWQTDTTAISATFSGQMRHTYHFQSRARDLAGLVEAWPIQPDASTSVGPLITKYYYHGGKRVAMRQGGVVQYLHGDHLGSTSLTTDESGAMVARQLYHPYGTTRYSEGTLATDFGFTGQRNVAGIGLMDYNARFYAPALGRFVSADTIVPEPGNPQAFNRYSYVENNPVRYTDPSGHCSAKYGSCGGGDDHGTWSSVRLEDQLMATRAYLDFLENPDYYVMLYWRGTYPEEIRILDFYAQYHNNTSLELLMGLAEGDFEKRHHELLQQVENGEISMDEFLSEGSLVWFYLGMVQLAEDYAEGVTPARFDTVHNSYDEALVVARGNAGDLGGSTQRMYDPETGTLIGEMSLDGKRGWRIDDDHVNWWDWSAGKKRTGGRYGHASYPSEQSGPHSKYIGYAEWE